MKIKTLDIIAAGALYFSAYIGMDYLYKSANDGKDLVYYDMDDVAAMSCLAFPMAYALLRDNDFEDKRKSNKAANRY